MSLIKYADGCGPMNPFTNVYGPFFNDNYFTDRMMSRVPAVKVLKEAVYNDGELCVEVPKKEEAKMASRQVEIK